MRSVAELVQFARVPTGDSYAACRRRWDLKLLWDLAVSVADAPTVAAADQALATADDFKPWTDDERRELRQMVVFARNPAVRERLSWAVPFAEAMTFALAEANNLRSAA